MFVLNHAGEICFFSMLLCISRLADSETESVSERMSYENRENKASSLNDTPRNHNL